MSGYQIPSNENPAGKDARDFLLAVRVILSYAQSHTAQFDMIQVLKQLDEVAKVKAFLSIQTLKEVADGLYSWLDAADLGLDATEEQAGQPTSSAASSAAQQAPRQTGAADPRTQTRIARLSEFSRAVAEAVRRVSVKVEAHAEVALLSKVSPLMDRHAKVLLSTLGLQPYSTLQGLTPELVLLADPRDPQTQNFLALFTGAVSRMLMSETTLTGVRQIPNMNYAAIAAEIVVFIERLSEYRFVRVGEFEENRFSK